MRYRLLGQTGLYVSELCLGTMTFGSQGFWAVMGGLKQAEVNVLVKESFDHGINFFDTANVYSLGESESLLGEAIKKVGLPREELVIATKSTGIMDDKLPNARGQSKLHIFNEVNASLKRLQIDHIDLYQLHGFDPLTPFEESLGALTELVKAGKIRYIGLCNMASWQIMKALSVSRLRGLEEFKTVQSYYSIAGRDLERDVIPLIEDQHLGLMVWSPLAGGYLSGKFSPGGSSPDSARRATFDFPPLNKDRADKCIEVMRPIAKKHNVSIAQIALAWILANKAVSTIIVGARKLEQLQDNIHASKLILDSADLTALNTVSALAAEYPNWMISMQAQYRANAPTND